VGGTLEFAAPENRLAPSFTVSLPGQELVARRIEVDASVDLAPYLGWYLSPELETLYQIVAGDDGGLVARHARNDDAALIAVAEDEFKGSQWFFGGVRFERDETGGVSGFRLSGGRVRNLYFKRVDARALGLE
jgi:hypothetical protein